MCDITILAGQAQDINPLIQFLLYIFKGEKSEKSSTFSGKKMTVKRNRKIPCRNVMFTLYVSVYPVKSSLDKNR